MDLQRPRGEIKDSARDLKFVLKLPFSTFVSTCNTVQNDGFSKQPGQSTICQVLQDSWHHRSMFTSQPTSGQTTTCCEAGK